MQLLKLPTSATVTMFYYQIIYSTLLNLHQQLKGKMRFYPFIVILFCCVCECTSVDIMPELKRNIVNFGYGINKYEGMLLHSFDRFYVVTKFVLPKVEDLKFLIIQFHSSCNYLDTDISSSKYPTNYIPNIRT